MRLSKSCAWRKSRSLRHANLVGSGGLWPFSYQDGTEASLRTLRPELFCHPALKGIDPTPRPWPIQNPLAGEDVYVKLRCAGDLTDEMTLRLLDWPDWCLLMHAQKRQLLGTQYFIQTQMRAARQE
jgi:hypothetical protein